VITSIVRLLAGRCRHRYGGRLRRPYLVQLHLGKEGVLNRVPADVVDHLPSDPRACVDDQWSREIDRAVGRLLPGGHDADDVGIAGVREPEALRLVVRHADLVVAVEQPRRGHGEGDLREVDGVEPEEGGILVLGDECPTLARQAGESVRKLDHRVVADFDRPEPGAFDVHLLGLLSAYRRKSSNDGWMSCDPALRAAW
jgi:hypothetical protein